MADTKETKKYQDSPDYSGYEDYSPEGRMAISAYNKAAENSKYADQYEVEGSPSRSKSGVEAAKKVIKETRPVGMEKRNIFAKRAVEGKKQGGSIRGGGCETKGKTKGRMI